jgi:hypothetical protein
MNFWDFYLTAAVAMALTLMLNSNLVDEHKEWSIIEYIVVGLFWPLILMEFLKNK